MNTSNARLILFLVTALRLTWLLTVDGFYFFSACRAHLESCDSYGGDEAAFLSACHNTRQQGSAMWRTALYVWRQCNNTDGELYYLLVATISWLALSFVNHYLWQPFVKRRRLEMDNVRMARHKREQGINVGL